MVGHRTSFQVKSQTFINAACIYNRQCPTALRTNMIAILISIICILLLYIYHASTKKFNYWKNQNVPHEPPVPIFGNYAAHILTKEYIGRTVQKLCQKFPNEPYIGAYFGTEPVFIPQDPEILKLVLNKDYNYFAGREVSDYYYKETLTQNLFFSSSDRWKVMRQNLTPLFSIAKMKNMFYLIERCSDMLADMLEREVSKTEVAEVRSLMTRYTLDCICSCSFGVDPNTMKSDSEENTFRKMGEMIFEISKYRAFKASARVIWPGLFYGLGFKNFPLDIERFFNNLMKGIYAERENKPSSRNDFVDLILALKTNGILELTGDSLKGDKKVSLEMNDDLITASCVGLFAAGFETSSTTLSLGLYELAKNKEAQARAIKEIDEYLKKNNGKITYECITELPYTLACMEETVRLYPVLGVVAREVMEDYVLPTGVKLEKGLRVHVPIYHINHNPEFFDDPEVFRPERLIPDEGGHVKPYTFMPFGDGQRICIGYRLAKMQVIPGFITVLRKYNVELAEDMPRTLVLEPKATVTQPDGGVRLKFVRRH